MGAGCAIKAMVQEHQIKTVVGEGQLLRFGTQRRQPLDGRHMSVYHAPVANSAAFQKVESYHVPDLKGMITKQIGKNAGQELAFRLQQVTPKLGVKPASEIKLQVGRGLGLEKTWKLHQKHLLAGKATLSPIIHSLNFHDGTVMPLSLTALPAFNDNYIWALSTGGDALVIDPGDAAVVDAWLAKHNLSLTTILITHHHADHTGGVVELKSRHKTAVIGPEEPIDGIDMHVAGNEHLDLPPFGKARVLAVPGHTRGHVAYYLPEERLLFAGDTLFSAGCGRLFEGTAAQMHASLKSLAELPDDTLLCCTHEYTQANLRFAAAVEPDNPRVRTRQEEVEKLRQQGRPSLPVPLGQERQYNPFLRCEEASVRSAVRHRTPHTDDPAAVFAALRSWKDGF